MSTLGNTFQKLSILFAAAAVIAVDPKRVAVLDFNTSLPGTEAAFDQLVGDDLVKVVNQSKLGEDGKLQNLVAFELTERGEVHVEVLAEVGLPYSQTVWVSPLDEPFIDEVHEEIPGDVIGYDANQGGGVADSATESNADGQEQRKGPLLLVVDASDLSPDVAKSLVH
ncbi:hypothetical protein [Methylobacillus sp.]|uniref:hypothetical protein n=1 Tax=Methylobacillus sp. TaxID=56818 RepID=UPI0012C407E8|nr:hypothetical protein [Methylobacillus sp.]MPS48513.1 hypothetical protein [Methylobacillus sp.]